VSPTELLAEHGSPLWLADVDRFRARLRDFGAAWRATWPETTVAYSYKTNRLLAFLRAAEDEGADAEVASEAEYRLATEIVGVDPSRVVVDGPAKADALLRRAGDDGALVLVDSGPELARAARASAGRVGLRVALPSFTGATTRFGIPPERIPEEAERATALGLSLEALSTHLVSTDFQPGAGSVDRPGSSVVVSWPRPPGEHARAAHMLAGLAETLASRGFEIGTIDLGGGFPPAPEVVAHATAVAEALRGAGYQGRVLLEPGRAIVADAVDLAFKVVAVKRLDDGTRCLVCDAGTNLLPGAAWGPPRIEPAGGAGRSGSPALVTGPLCLNIDVLHSGAELPKLEPGEVLLARGVGAYHQAASTHFGEPRPAVIARDRGRWRVARPAETVEDLVEPEMRLELVANTEA
jgi:diaminopimelate decarboxylase